MRSKYSLQNSGRIVKSRSNDPFTRIPNQTARDKNLSLKAKGLLLQILSLPDDWKIYKTNLESFCSDGYHTISTSWNELVENGYIDQKRVRNDNGHFVGWDYIVYDKSQKITDIDTVKPISGFPISDKPISENPQLQINSEQRKNIKTP